MSSREHVCNIGERGARRRKFSGYAWAMAAIGSLITLAAVHAPRWATLLLALPIALASVGFLQAREKT